MVRHSLIVKISLYATIVFFASIPPAIMVGEMLRSQGHRDAARAFNGPPLEFLARETERSVQGKTPSPQRLAELGRGLRHHLRFVPWSQVGAYPPSLRTQMLVLDPRPPHEGPHHWVRIDHAGHPIGALEAIPDFSRGPRPPGPLTSQLALTWVLLLVLIIAPPIWLWVIRPLRAMVRVASRLGSGDLETAVPIERQDEFGELERAFERMRVELRRALMQRERLLTDVSHEVRGPLTRMTLALPLLRQQGASGPVLDIMEREIKAADELLGDVLALARGQTPSALALAPVDLGELARRLVEERAIVANQRRQRLAATLEPATVWGDRRQLERAFGNVLDNALKYTPEGGEVSVSTGCEGEQGFFRVIDNGPGVAAEHLPLIFEPFYRPDDSRSRETGGTGLGLAIVRAITENHGGKVRFDSKQGEGTRVELRFRLTERSPLGT
ncbi:MAG TPA: HAMP domain-containing sensor histidine kinase [Stenomitos sp.]